MTLSVTVQRPHNRLRVGDNVSFYAHRQGFRAWLEAEIDAVSKDGQRVRVRLVTPGPQHEVAATDWMHRGDALISIHHKRSDADPPPHLQYVNANQSSNMTILEEKSMKYLVQKKGQDVPVQMDFVRDEEEEKDLEEPAAEQTLHSGHSGHSAHSRHSGHSQQDTQHSVGTDSGSDGDSVDAVDSMDAVEVVIDEESAPKRKALSKYEKKMKKYKGTDLREKAFMAMADSSRSLDSKGLHEFLSWNMQRIGRKAPSQKKVARFFEAMHPNNYNLVGFSQFVKVVDADGDVIAAFDRFTASQPKTKRQKSKKKAHHT